MKTVTKYEASSLEEIAAYFDQLAKEAEELSLRIAGKARGLAQNRRAQTWRDAAAIVRDTRLVTMEAAPVAIAARFDAPRKRIVQSAYAALAPLSGRLSPALDIKLRVAPSEGWGDFWRHASEKDVCELERALGLRS